MGIEDPFPYTSNFDAVYKCLHLLTYLFRIQMTVVRVVLDISLLLLLLLHVGLLLLSLSLLSLSSSLLLITKMTKLGY